MDSGSLSGLGVVGNFTVNLQLEETVVGVEFPADALTRTRNQKEQCLAADLVNRTAPGPVHTNGQPERGLRLKQALGELIDLALGDGAPHPFVVSGCNFEF